MNPQIDGDTTGFTLEDFNAARPFSGFLPGIAGAYGKPLWAFYTNRGQCISSFGVRDKNASMLEFHPANKAYALTSLYGFRSFIKLNEAAAPVLYEPFQGCASTGKEHRFTVRAHEIEIEDTNRALGLRMRVVYFTLPGENLPALVRRVTLENIGLSTRSGQVLDGLPQIVPYGLGQNALKMMSRTMEAFAEVCHVDEKLPFFKLKVEASDEAEVRWLHEGFFSFTMHQGQSMPVVCDPDQVFGFDTSLRHPLSFIGKECIDALAGRRETLTACAFAHLPLSLKPGASMSWESYFGQVPDWLIARSLRDRVKADALYAVKRRDENASLISGLSSRFALLARPQQLDPYTQQAFLDNTLRGGQPVVISGPRGPRVFHSFTRKHGDMERDYNFFELAPSYWSQGSSNFRDVNQNRRSENFTFPGVDAANIETFFDLIQIDGNNPLSVHPEQFILPSEQLNSLKMLWLEGANPCWQEFLSQPFSPGQLHEMLITDCATLASAQSRFETIIGLADRIQGATHGEGYWVDHWIYNLDLIDSYAALYPDRLGAVLLAQPRYSFFDSDYVVQPRDKKYVLRQDGSVRQLHAVVQDMEKTALMARRSEQAQCMRTQHGLGPIYRTSLLGKIVSLLAVKASLFDPFGIGLEMETEKPGWCDALNGLPGLFGSSTHEAYALQRWAQFCRRTVSEHLRAPEQLIVSQEVATLIRSVTETLTGFDGKEFFPTWQRLATEREAFREQVRLGVSGVEQGLSGDELLRFIDAALSVLDRGLAQAVDAQGLPVSYTTHEVVEFDLLPSPGHAAHEEAPAQHVRARRFSRKPVAAFLEGTVHALRSGKVDASALYAAVRRSELFDQKLGMYRVNVPLDRESFEIGRSRVFAPGWLENESIFLHMHYKFLLETLRSGLATEFFEDLKRGLVAFHDPKVYGRSPLENSSFIASSRFPDARVHGAGFVARLSGATAEWISMVLHMGLGAEPFRLVDGALRFEPRPMLADWLFTTLPTEHFSADGFGFKLFGQTWIVYQNPSRRPTFGPHAVAPVSYQLNYLDGRRCTHHDSWLPQAMALDLREQGLASLVIQLG